MTFGPTILTMVPERHLHWKGRLLGIPLLLTGNHHFVLQATETGETRFEQTEYFSGILAVILGWIGSDIYESTSKGFGLMNEALKARVEHQVQEGMGEARRRVGKGEMVS